eukprot:489688_1
MFHVVPFLICLLLVYVNGELPHYFIDAQSNCDSVVGALVEGPKTNTPYITYLGEFTSAKDCSTACIAKTSNNNHRCESYTYYTATNTQDNGIWKNQCYGRFGYPYWNPAPNQKNANCGRIIYDCSNDLDCSLNGICNTNKTCTCRTGWKGYHCELLNLLPATKGTGYNISEGTNNAHTSSWGGGVVIDDNDSNEATKYHMILAEMINHCGIHAWIPNSRVTHAQSTNGFNSAYKRINVIEIPFSHEPNIIRGNNNEYIIYYTDYNYPISDQCNCTDGSTPKTCKRPENVYYYTSMVYSLNITDLNGWSEPINVLGVRTISDTNLAGIINKDGSFIGFDRYWSGYDAGSIIYLVTATNWKDNTTYIEHKNVLFPEMAYAATEDPSLYIDCNGNYHAIFHHMDPNQWQQTCGGHAFSKDGIDWIYGGVAWSNVVQFDDNTSVT